MKTNVIMCVLLAALMFIIPMAALGSGEPALPSITARLGTSGQAAQTTPGTAESVTAAAQTQAAVTAAVSGVQALYSTDVEAMIEALGGDSFKLYDRSNGKVLELTAREYVLGSVCAEMPPTFSAEAIKAQAVASHSYALRIKYENKDNEPDPQLHGADISVDSDIWFGYASEAQMRERYGDNFDEYWRTITKAVDSVMNYILVYDEKPIVAAYHAISAGRTEDARNVWGGYAPYLTAVDSLGDDIAPQYRTTESFAAKRVYSALQSAGAENLPDDPSALFSGIQRSPSGYITTIYAGETEFTGMRIRNLFELRSANFEVEYNAEEEAFVFEVTGYGHGVGLSQYGAEYMAQQGASFDEILLHYYQQAHLVRLPE